MTKFMIWLKNPEISGYEISKSETQSEWRSSANCHIHYFRVYVHGNRKAWWHDTTLFFIRLHFVCYDKVDRIKFAADVYNDIEGNKVAHYDNLGPNGFVEEYYEPILPW